MSSTVLLPIRRSLLVRRSLFNLLDSRCAALTCGVYRDRIRVTPDVNLIPVRRLGVHKGGGGGGGKKGKQKGNKASIDDLLDELDDDDDDDDDDGRSRHEREMEDDVAGVANTPVAKFMREQQKGGGGKAAKKNKDHNKKGTKHHTGLTYLDARRLMDVDACWDELGACVDDLKHHFSTHLSVRSATAFDDLPVDLEGDKFPLREVASISKKDPKRVVVDCATFPQATKGIMKALENSGMNLNPQQDGTRIYVPVPKVTKEHRERLAKGAKSKCNETKDALRKVQTHWLSRVSDAELESISAAKDQLHALRELVMSITQHFVAEAEKATIAKQADVMGKST